jgi:hypothetical protein
MSIAATRLNVGRSNQTVRRLPENHFYIGWLGRSAMLFFWGGGLNHISSRILEPGNTHRGVILIISFDPTMILNNFLTAFYRQLSSMSGNNETVGSSCIDVDLLLHSEY